MKTTLLSTLFLIVSSFTFGQISITVEGAAHTSGTPYTFSSDANALSINALINNTSGAPLDLEIKRVIFNQLASWSEQLCWATSSDGGLSGQCYNNIQNTNPYTSPDSYVVEDGDNGVFKATIDPNDPDFGCVDYRYYIIQDGTTVLDSIDITVCKSVSVEELEPALAITIAPNPASSYFTVKTNGAEGTTIKVVDVLGNVVLKETVMGSSKTITTSAFRNGIYFVMVETENQQRINRKVIVRN
jgi:hypothetical protein